MKFHAFFLPCTGRCYVSGDAWWTVVRRLQWALRSADLEWRGDAAAATVAPPSDSKAFFDYAKKLATNAGLRKKMTEAGRDIAVKTFHWHEVFNNLVNYYDVLVQAVPPSHA